MQVNRSQSEFVNLPPKSFLDTLEQNVDNIASIYQLHELKVKGNHNNNSGHCSTYRMSAKDYASENKENIPLKFAPPSQCSKTGREQQPQTILKQPLSTLSANSSGSSRNSPKKVKKLTFKLNPIIIPEDEELDDDDQTNLSIISNEDSTVSDFLNNHSAATVEERIAEFEGYTPCLSSTETIIPDTCIVKSEQCETRVSPPISLSGMEQHELKQSEYLEELKLKRERAIQQQERLKQLRMEQQELIKQNQAILAARMNDTPQIFAEEIRQNEEQGEIQQECHEQNILNAEQALTPQTSNEPVISSSVDSKTPTAYFNERQKRFRDLIHQQKSVNLSDVASTDTSFRDHDTSCQSIERSTSKQSIPLFNHMKSPSRTIIRSVLNTPLRSQNAKVLVESFSEKDSLSALTSLAEDSWEEPKFEYSDPSHTIRQHIPFLSVVDPKSRMESLNTIYGVMKRTLPSEEVLNELCESLLLTLQRLESNDEQYNNLAIVTLGKTRIDSHQVVDTLVSILSSPAWFPLYESCVQALLTLGVTGLAALVEISREASSEFDSYILTHVANHPVVQHFVIIPALMKECSSSDLDRRVGAVKCLLQLGTRSVGSINTLVNVLIAGSVSRKLVVEAIKRCGEEGERTLLQMLHNKNPRVRACSAFILGRKLSKLSMLKVLVNTDFASRFSSSRISFHVDEQEQKHYLVFDARDLQCMIRRGISEGTFYNMSVYDFELDSSVVLHLIHVLSQKKFQNSSGIGNISSLGFSTADTSLDLLKSHIMSIQAPEQANPDSVEGTNQTNILAKECVIALANTLNDSDEEVRIEAATSLGLIGMPDAEDSLPSLKWALKDQSNKVRAAVVSSLGLLGRDLHVKPIKEVAPILRNLVSLVKDTHWNVRIATIAALTNFGTQVCEDRETERVLLPLLVKLLKDGSVPRNEVSRCLMSIGDKGVIQVMALMQQQAQTTSQVRISTAYGLSLANMRSPYIDQIVQCLFGAASKDRVPLVRKAVIGALGTLAQQNYDNSVTYLRPRSLLPFLYSFMRDKEGCVREMAAEVLAFSGPHGELLLIEGLLNDSNNVIRASAAYGLKFVGPRTIRSLLLALNDRDPYVLRAVTCTIEAIGINAIVEELKDRPRQHRQSVILSAKELLSSPYPVPASLQFILSGLVSLEESNLESNPPI